MHSISNYDNYVVCKRNHDTAKQFRSMHREYLTARMKCFLTSAATLAAFLFWLHLLEGMGT